jgi:hypothetical protein
MYINYEKINPSVKIEASYCFLKVVPPETHIRNIKFDHNDIPDKIYYKTIVNLEGVRAVAREIPQVLARAVALPTAPPDEWGQQLDMIWAPAWQRLPAVPTAPLDTSRIVGTDSQSVHQSSIQKTANESLNYVMNYVPKKTQPEDLITEVINAYKMNAIRKSRMRRFFFGIANKWAESGIKIPPIRKWCLENNIHSQYGFTYKSLLKQVWAIIEDHEHKEAMREVLFQELDESKNVCFTGRFTRTLNALTGFIEEVKIGINSKEQMGNQIAMAIRKAKDRFGDDFQSEARANVKKILVDFEVPDVEHEVWLDAIE